MLVITLSTLFKNIISHSDSSVKLVGVAGISDSSITTRLNGTTWQNYYKNSYSSSMIEFESIWESETKNLYISFDCSSFNRNTSYQGLYFMFDYNGTNESAFVIREVDSGNNYKNIILIQGHNNFKINLGSSDYEGPGTITSTVTSLDNPIREGFGSDPGYNIQSKQILDRCDKTTLITRNSFYRYLFSSTSSDFILNKSGEQEIDQYKFRYYTSLSISCQGMESGGKVKLNHYDYVGDYGGYPLYSDYDGGINSSVYEWYSETLGKHWYLPIFGQATFDEYLIVNGRPRELLRSGVTISISKIPNVRFALNGTVVESSFDPGNKILKYDYTDVEDKTLYTSNLIASIARPRAIEKISQLIEGKTVTYYRWSELQSKLSPILSNVLTFYQQP